MTLCKGRSLLQPKTSGSLRFEVKLGFLDRRVLHEISTGELWCCNSVLHLPCSSDFAIFNALKALAARCAECAPISVQSCGSCAWVVSVFDADVNLMPLLELPASFFELLSRLDARLFPLLEIVQPVNAWRGMHCSK